MLCHDCLFSAVICELSFFFPNPRGVYPIAVYTGRLCLKEVPFSGYKVYKRAGISRVEVYESARKSTILVFKRTKRANRRIFAVNNSRKLVIYPYLQDGAYVGLDYIFINILTKSLALILEIYITLYNKCIM